MKDNAGSLMKCWFEGHRCPTKRLAEDDALMDAMKEELQREEHERQEREMLEHRAMEEYFTKHPHG